MRVFLFTLVLLLFSGCTSVSSIKTVFLKDAPKEQKKIYQGLKLKVAIARFSNETKYAKSSLFGLDNSLDKQATDILSTKLAMSGKFILLERKDLKLIEKEQRYAGITPEKVGANLLIIGSISEFGRKEMSDVGVFSRKLIKVAYAGVNVRLVDVRTGRVVFAQDGAGEAKSEAGKNFGVGMHAGYDSTLNDKALAAAISSLTDALIKRLNDEKWKSYILAKKAGNIIIAGGKEQGVKVGDIFSVLKQGGFVKNPQTGMKIELPGEEIAKIKVLSLFGSDYTNEGSICKLVSGEIGENYHDLYVEK